MAYFVDEDGTKYDCLPRRTCKMIRKVIAVNIANRRVGGGKLELTWNGDRVTGWGGPYMPDEGDKAREPSPSELEAQRRMAA